MRSPYSWLNCPEQAISGFPFGFEANLMCIRCSPGSLATHWTWSKASLHIERLLYPQVFQQKQRRREATHHNEDGLVARDDLLMCEDALALGSPLSLSFIAAAYFDNLDIERRL